MFGRIFVLVGIAFSTLSFGQIERNDFTEWFRSSFNRASAFPTERAEKARNLRYVFVKGFLNELTPGYFTDNIARLKSLGVPDSHIDIVSPSSGQSFTGNVGNLNRKLSRHFTGKEELVIIAHSRGAVDALAWAIYNAGPFQRNVKELFLVQGPFGGSGVADYFSGEGHPIDFRMPKYAFVAGFLKGLYYGGAVDFWIQEGMSTLTTRVSSAFWKRTLRNFSGMIPLVREKIHFITASTYPDEVSTILLPAAWYLHTYYGSNDGLVVRRDQAIEEVGNIILTIKGDHASLTNAWPMSDFPSTYRQAFTDAIVLSVTK
jgi:hypothetical protein